MGRQKLRLKRVELDKLDKGYFPNKDFDDVPDGGSADCKHVLWNRSALRKMFGMDRINSSAAATTRGQGVHYLDVSGVTKRAAVFGSGFYEDVSGTWTARTGAITIIDAVANQVQMVNWQAGANKYLVGANGVDAPFKWTGSGNAAVLAGSPPLFSTIAKYHTFFWGALNENVYFSALSDPETWDTAKWIVPFDRDINCLIDNGQKLAVLKNDTVGSVQGYGPLDFTAEPFEIKNVGCVGRLAATKAFFGPSRTEVIATLSKDGLWIIDQAFSAEKIFGDNYISTFSQSNLARSCVAYNALENLLFVAMPSTTATSADYLVVVDMSNGAIWPCPDIHANSIRAMASCRDDSGNEFIYFIDSSGFAFKFNRDTKNYHTGSASQAIDARFKTKKFDLKDVHDLREASMLSDAVGNWNVTMAIAFGLVSDDGESNVVNQQNDNALLTSSFTLGASTLGGSSYVFDYLSTVGGFGRYMTITLTNANLNESFNIRKIELQLKRRRMGSNDK